MEQRWKIVAAHVRERDGRGERGGKTVLGRRSRRKINSEPREREWERERQITGRELEV